MHFFLVIVVLDFVFVVGGDFDRLEISEPLTCVLICI